MDLSIIFAFQRFLLEVSGTVTNLLAFDEIFDNLDTRGVELALDVIESLFPEVEAFYVVTHNDSIKSVFTSVVEIEYVDYVSSIKGDVRVAN
jgi:DNA repair exonuclease SbcCD ATPase subunit